MFAKNKTSTINMSEFMVLVKFFVKDRQKDMDFIFMPSFHFCKSNHVQFDDITMK